MTWRSILQATFKGIMQANVQCAAEVQPYWKCGLCNKMICLGAGGKGCQIALHNVSMFGLARCNFLEVLGGKMKEWKAPNETAKWGNVQWINKLQGLLMKEDKGDE
jgi:hypothetical protein